MLTFSSSNKKPRGKGFLNTLINKLPFELHLPGGFEFCGPGTKLQKRLERGDRGINPLDAQCRLHDIAYRDNTDLQARHRADHILQEKAWERFKSKDASVGEKAAAWAVTTAMKTKRKLGMGIKKKRNKKISFKTKILNNLLKSIGGGKSINATLKTTKSIVNSIGGKQNVKVPRIIPIPDRNKQGGFLPFLIPLFAGLSAAGALAGGASGIAKAVNDAKAAKKQLEENSRHNKTMESIALGKQGSGIYLKKTKRGSALYLKPYKTGSALYLKPYRSKN